MDFSENTFKIRLADQDLTVRLQPIVWLLSDYNPTQWLVIMRNKAVNVPIKFKEIVIVMIKPEFVDCQLRLYPACRLKKLKRNLSHCDLFAKHCTLYLILKCQNINGRDVDLLTSSVQISVLTKWVNNNNIQFGKVEDWSLWCLKIRAFATLKLILTFRICVFQI